MILCNLKHLNLNFGQKTLFHEAELTIRKGDRIGLIGLNGQGKSTLFRILKGEIKPDKSEPPFEYNTSNEQFDIFHIPQELNTKDFSDLPIRDFYLSFYPELLKIHKQLKDIETKLTEGSGDFEKLLSKQEKLLRSFEEQGGWDLQNGYLNYLKRFELDELDRDVTYLSGGEKRKMALSLGLSSPAEILLWDEPTNHLDIETIENFEDELLNCKKTFLIISHDRYLLNHTTNKIFHIENGQVHSFNGTYLNYLEYLEEKEKERQSQLEKLENKHRRELAWMRQGIKARGTRSKKRVEGFQQVKKDIEKIKSQRKREVDLNLAHSGRKTKILIDIEDGRFSYSSDEGENRDKEIFRSLNLTVAKKDKIALIGANGAGKTTLIKIFENRLQLSKGKLKRAEDLKVVTFDQNREQLDENKTPYEIVGDGKAHVTLGNGHQQHVHSYLMKFLFTKDQVGRPVSTLSGGEKNRLQLALFMKQAADLWIFDEPTNDLDIETIEILENELRNYKDAVIIISHDRAFLDNVCQKSWLIHDHQIECFEGGFTQVAPYIEYLKAKEAEEAKSKSQEVQRTKNSSNSQKGLTYKEKQRLADIEEEILQAESTLEEFENDLASFDFTQMDEKKKTELEKLTNKKNRQESVVKSLYDEWENLSERDQKED